jgi:hypothetical protein
MEGTVFSPFGVDNFSQKNISGIKTKNLIMIVDDKFPNICIWSRIRGIEKHTSRVTKMCDENSLFLT